MAKPNDLVQGTLDLLILKTVLLEPKHGWAIAKRIQRISGQVLQVQQGSLYPALHRLEQKAWIVQAGDPEFVRVIRVTANIFPLYGMAATLGRTFTADEDRPGTQNVTVLTYRLWDGRFGQNPSIISCTHNS